MFYDYNLLRFVCYYISNLLFCYDDCGSSVERVLGSIGYDDLGCSLLADDCIDDIDFIFDDGSWCWYDEGLFVVDIGGWFDDDEDVGIVVFVVVGFDRLGNGDVDDDVDDGFGVCNKLY